MTRRRGREFKKNLVKRQQDSSRISSNGNKDRRKHSSESDSSSSGKSGDLSRDVFVGNIPKTATKKDVVKAMSK